MKNTFEEVQNLIAERLDIDKLSIKKESSFKNDLGADSLDVVEMVMEIEDIFEIEIADEDSENLKTVQDLVEYIDQKNKVNQG
ncbi:acyl carrier protein [Jeotgalibacillus proteolyticus]|uniref:Acyl carrier protein n=1 Tax=Jeotgalibacillus proteolyticus TaxID=2082395 RepID=A0A2S5G725_9BACL|nr:acyl carrier protein [Jeotgalibacillus proteolyticus]PPA68712.1 acyl carrier protein [Jeotgalibacillus proteolyticus]PPA68789.1 acyl carrier protein [Jeotgalibacillus proteolyticus]